MNYLLDTNACIAIIKKHPIVTGRLRRELQSGSRIFASSIAAFELFYGAVNSAHQAENKAAVDTLHGTHVTAIDFDVADAEAAGDIRAKLEKAGTPIGPYDVLIAGQARCRDLVVVTANEREFRRVPGLRWENWAK